MANGYDFSTPMLNLGGFIFCVNTAAYQHLRRISEYRWATLERINHRPSLQWVGQGIEEYELQGVIYPTFRSSFRVLDGLRNLAQTGQPQQLTSGLGDDLGLWCVLAVDELHEQVSFKGAPLKQEFALRLRNFGPDQEKPGIKAFVTPTLTLQQLGLAPPSISDLVPPDISLPTSITPLSAVIPDVAASQLLPYNAALSQAGMSPQQAAQAVTSSAKTFQQVLSTAQQIINAIAATKSTLQNVQSNFATDPAGTVAGLLNMTTADATAASGAMTTMFGSDLSGISNVTAALQQANMTIQGAQGGLSNDTLGTMARILTAGGGLPSSSLTTLFGSSTAGQMAVLGSAIQITDMGAQVAGVTP